jgi:adenosylcobinamide-phosphate synthase
MNTPQRRDSSSQGRQPYDKTTAKKYIYLLAGIVYLGGGYPDSWMPVGIMSGVRNKIIFTALLLDLTLGDPPNRYHPVAWMGSAIAAMQRRAPRRGRLAYGALIAWGGALTAAGAGRFIEVALARLPSQLSWAMEAGLLKMTFSLSGLVNAAREIDAALQAGDLPKARRLAAWHLVSRDTFALNASQVAAATIESLAENASDGVVAPLCYYTAGGLPATLAYRYVSTTDSMLGYRDEAREWLGKVPARSDDVLNLLPARLTALLMVAAALLTGQDVRGCRRIWKRDSGQTASPNAGHPMSAAAGALGVALEKVGHYKLGAGLRPPRREDIGRAVRLVQVTVGLAAVLCMLVSRRACDGED